MVGSVHSYVNFMRRLHFGCVELELRVVHRDLQRFSSCRAIESEY